MSRGSTFTVVWRLCASSSRSVKQGMTTIIGSGTTSSKWNEAAAVSLLTSEVSHCGPEHAVARRVVDKRPSRAMFNGMVMPLRSVDVPPRDEGFEVGFLMMDGERRIRCYAQEGALDVIETGRTNDAAERMARFDRYRHAFEALASKLYDAGLPVRITSAHVGTLMAFIRATGPKAD